MNKLFQLFHSDTINPSEVYFYHFTNKPIKQLIYMYMHYFLYKKPE